MTFLKKLWEAVAGYFRGGRAEQDLRAAREMVGVALPLVESFARKTPNRSDDELAALFREFALPNLDRFLGLPREKRGLALLDGVSMLLSRTYPGSATRVLNTAVQIAYLAFRAGQEPRNE